MKTKLIGKLLGGLCGAALCMSASSQALAVTAFEQDVATSIDRGIAYLDSANAFNNPSSSGDAAGLPLLALLEKRASGIPTDPPQGYSGASAVDQGRMRKTVAYILGQIDNGTFYTSYQHGNYLMAVSLYLRTGGPDRGAHADLPAALPYALVSGINKMVDDILSYQQASGYWCYGLSYPSCNDSSTTQFAVAGLASAKSVYSDPSYADAARLAAINTALANARQGYITHALTGSDNSSCGVVDATERGHGYNADYYNPSLQQTSSGTWVQLLGGATVNDGTIQAYVDWIRNHYRYTNINSLGNGWEGSSYWYYLWSSFKGMEFIRQSGIPPNPGNVGPDSLGLLGPNATCNVRELQRDPAALPQVASFGAGGVGFYSAEPKNQYFDYAYSILGYQCPQGGGSPGFYGCNGSPGRWDTYASQAYALLVLQRATGGACNDSDGDGVCDDVDNCPGVSNPGQEDSNNNGIGNACEVFTKCDVDTDSDIDKIDLSLISKARNKLASGPDDPRDANGDGKITAADVKVCTVKCTRANCATQ